MERTGDSPRDQPGISPSRSPHRARMRRFTSRVVGERGGFPILIRPADELGTVHGDLQCAPSCRFAPRAPERRSCHPVHSSLALRVSTTNQPDASATAWQRVRSHRSPGATFPHRGFAVSRSDERGHTAIPRVINTAATCNTFRNRAPADGSANRPAAMPPRERPKARPAGFLQSRMLPLPRRLPAQPFPSCHRADQRSCARPWPADPSNASRYCSFR